MKQIINFSVCLGIVMISGCANIERSMVFSTGTTIGLEVAVSPSSEDPVNVVIGYKRAEVLLDPIMEDAPENKSQDNRRTFNIIPRAHSVIAKLLGDMKTKGSTKAGPEAEAGLRVSQWFASGNAADILAKNGGAAALTDDPEVSAIVAKAATLTSSEGEIPDVVFSLTNQLYLSISDLRTDDTVTEEIRNQAGHIYYSLNKSGLMTKVPGNLTKYVIQTDTATEKKYRMEKKSFSSITDFQRVLNYRSELRYSLEDLSTLRKAIAKGGVKIEDNSSGTAKVLDEKGKEALLTAYDEQNKALSDWQKSMVEDPQFKAMWYFLAGN